MFRPLVHAGVSLRRCYSVSSSTDFLVKYGDAWENHDLGILSQAGSHYLNEVLQTAANQLTLLRDPSVVANDLFHSVSSMPTPLSNHFLGPHIFKDFDRFMRHLRRLRHIPQHLQVDYLRTGLTYANCHLVLFDLKYCTFYGVAGLQDHPAHEMDMIEVTGNSSDAPYRLPTKKKTRFYDYYDGISLSTGANFDNLGYDLSQVQNDYIKETLLKLIFNNQDCMIMMRNPKMILTTRVDFRNLEPCKYLEAFRTISIHMKNKTIREEQVLSLHMYLGVVPITVWNMDASRGIPDHLGISETLF